MIGKLTGILDSTTKNQLILDVNGVGYLVSCPASTLARAGAEGGGLTLWIETIVREDAINLYGFIEESERDWFRLLTTVQGVGSKAALSILSVLSPERLAGAIATQDKAPLTAADGVGPKLAGRIVSELKDKVAHITLTSFHGSNVIPLSKNENSTAQDALSALLHLGYRRMEAFAAIHSAEETCGADASLDALIRAALTELAKDKSA